MMLCNGTSGRLVSFGSKEILRTSDMSNRHGTLGTSDMVCITGSFRTADVSGHHGTQGIFDMSCCIGAFRTAGTSNTSYRYWFKLR